MHMKQPLNNTPDTAEFMRTCDCRFPMGVVAEQSSSQHASTCSWCMFFCLHMTIGVKGLGQYNVGGIQVQLLLGYD